MQRFVVLRLNHYVDNQKNKRNRSRNQPDAVIFQFIDQLSKKTEVKISESGRKQKAEAELHSCRNQTEIADIFRRVQQCVNDMRDVSRICHNCHGKQYDNKRLGRAAGNKKTEAGEQKYRSRKQELVKIQTGSDRNGGESRNQNQKQQCVINARTGPAQTEMIMYGKETECCSRERYITGIISLTQCTGEILHRLSW